LVPRSKRFPWPVSPARRCYQRSRSTTTSARTPSSTSAISTWPARENPRCTGDIHDRTDKGGPILEIDHIHDLALGGDDDPLQVIALCPNCHAAKTRGTKRADLKPILLATAKARHGRLSKPG
jgi:5-methylcytosine-specific restriction enzyme A